MNIGIVSSRYAKALYRFAEEKGTTQQVYGEMQQMAFSFSNVPGLARVLQNPVMSREKLETLLISAANCGKDVSATTKKFINLCITQKREELLHFIALSYIRQYEVANNIVGGLLTVARPIPKELIGKFQAIVEGRTGKKVDLKVNVSPSIMGGFILQYGDNKLDASLQEQVKQMHRKLVR